MGNRKASLFARLADLIPANTSLRLWYISNSIIPCQFKPAA